ncbi:MAG: sugar kinase [Candidatus Tectomicrobia bacterium]|uniref:Sugar kinase n=1 Tax=Tectimicrobiota bacterium TaxID=2528274 RepID=A0A933GL13_UNCTE|nr:sugar kinase [Candidatus Tectomicrobia bacterium]
MSLLVVGSVALDSLKTPFGERMEVLGGSATHFSISASFFTQVYLVGVVGEDFPREHIRLFQSHNVDVRGLQIREGKTFRWSGSYLNNINEAETLKTELNVFQEFKPDIPEAYQSRPYVFLANIDPELQQYVLRQVKKPKLIACDTMNFWIKGKREALLETFKSVDMLVINEAETKELAQESNLVKAAKIILKWGPRYLIVKRGEYGVLLVAPSGIFAAPAYPLESVVDPTGAGDTFAGGLMGFLASQSQHNHFEEKLLRQGVIMGSVMASFNVEDFSLERLKSLSMPEIKQRFDDFKNLTHFEAIA